MQFKIVSLKLLCLIDKLIDSMNLWNKETLQIILIETFDFVLYFNFGYKGISFVGRLKSPSTSNPNYKKKVFYKINETTDNYRDCIFVLLHGFQNSIRNSSSLEFDIFWDN